MNIPDNKLSSPLGAHPYPLAVHPLGSFGRIPPELQDNVLLRVVRDEPAFLDGYYRTCRTAYRQSVDLAIRIRNAPVAQLRASNRILNEDARGLHQPVTYDTALQIKASAFMAKLTEPPSEEQSRRIAVHADVRHAESELLKLIGRYPDRTALRLDLWRVFQRRHPVEPYHLSQIQLNYISDHLFDDGLDVKASEQLVWGCLKIPGYERLAKDHVAHALRRSPGTVGYLELMSIVAQKAPREVMPRLEIFDHMVQCENHIQSLANSPYWTNQLANNIGNMMIEAGLTEQALTCFRFYRGYHYKDTLLKLCDHLLDVGMFSRALNFYNLNVPLPFVYDNPTQEQVVLRIMEWYLREPIEDGIHDQISMLPKSIYRTQWSSIIKLSGDNVADEVGAKLWESGRKAAALQFFGKPIIDSKDLLLGKLGAWEANVLADDPKRLHVLIYALASKQEVNYPPHAIAKKELLRLVRNTYKAYVEEASKMAPSSRKNEFLNDIRRTEDTARKCNISLKQNMFSSFI